MIRPLLVVADVIRTYEDQFTEEFGHLLSLDQRRVRGSSASIVSREDVGGTEESVSPGEACVSWATHASDICLFLLLFVRFFVSNGVGGVQQSSLRRPGTSVEVPGSLHSSSCDFQSPITQDGEWIRGVSVPGLRRCQSLQDDEASCHGASSSVPASCSSIWVHANPPF